VRGVIVLHLSTLDHRLSFLKVFQEIRKDLGDEARHNIGRRIRGYDTLSRRSFARGFARASSARISTRWMRP